MATKAPQPIIRLLSADLDGTLLGRHGSTLRFREKWEEIERAKRPWLVYNSGRPVADVLTLVAQGVLAAPDAIIGGVGTELHVPKDPAATSNFRARFGAHWDLAEVERVVSRRAGIVRQPPEFLHPFKSSWLWREAPPGLIQELRDELAATGIKASLIYSGGHFLDVLPAESDKGQSLAWLCQQLGLDLAYVAVAGDTANDSAMFRLPGVSRILVRNALPELRDACRDLPHFDATRPMADGVIEGLRHFGVFTPVRRGRVLGLARNPA
jgi:sucrose-6F-phosphate phosphohydrolase